MNRDKSIIINILIFLAVSSGLLWSGCTQKYAKDYMNLKYPQLRQIELPLIEQVTLDNGMKLYLAEDHELPLISASAMIRTGSVYEPANKVGLASITGAVMRTGGTTSRTGDQIDEELEQIAASVETGIGLSSGSASMSVLKEDVDTGLEILADVLMNPAFSQDKIELEKVRQKSAIARRNDQPFGIASREYTKLIYGPESPYARHTEYVTIDNITRDDLVAFHKKFYKPNNTMLAVWGDFDTEEMIKKIEDAFKGWTPAEVETADMPQVDYQYAKTVNLVTKEDLNQSCILMGHIGGVMSDPDYFPLVVMNEILGGSFTSRLFRNVRSRLGLAYSVSGNYSSSYDHPGIFYVACQTKLESTIQAINAMSDEVRKMTESEVTDEELSLAKDAFLNSFVFNFDSTGEIVRRMMTYEYYGYPSDFLQRIKENVEKVTNTDVLRVAREHLHPEQMQVMVVGKPEGFDKPLSELGRVNQIDVTIPAP